MPTDPSGFIEFLKSRKHRAAELLEVQRWNVLEEEPGWLHVECHLPDSVLNVSGFLFGGFTPVYVDLLAIWTCVTTLSGPRQWLATVNMRVDYLEPIVRPGFRAKSRLVNARKKRDYLVETSFVSLDHEKEKLLAFALTTMRKTPRTKLPEASG